MLAYGLQLYFDFSAYSDMAIGIGLMIGFRLPENFNRPYSSVSVTDFWRRWHMTLSRWFRDYVYIPLGGSRGTAAETSRNLLIVFLLTGIWHGAGWTFLIWGMYHGAWLMIERKMGWRAIEGEVHRGWLRRGSLVLIVFIGWVLFRAETIGDAFHYYETMLSLTPGITATVHVALSTQAMVTLIVASGIFLLPGARNGARFLTEGTGLRATAARVGVMLILPLVLLMSFANDYSPFLYFQF